MWYLGTCVGIITIFGLVGLFWLWWEIRNAPYAIEDDEHGFAYTDENWGKSALEFDPDKEENGVVDMGGGRFIWFPDGGKDG